MVDVVIKHSDWSYIKDIPEDIDLIYLDPPFYTQKRHKMSTDNGDIFFDDIWNNFDEYIDWLVDVVTTSYDKLSNVGTLYSHNNFTLNAELISRLPDRIKKNYQTTIYWQRSHPHNNIKNSWGNIVDTILVISKTKSPYFNVQYQELDSTYKNNSFNNKDEVGHYSLTPITGEKSRIGHNYEYNGVTPKYGWRRKLEIIKEFDDNNLIHWGKNKPYKKLYLHESKGRPIQNFWNDIHPITRSEKNKRQYPTQKPVLLLERIIKSSCPVGGVVVDPFAGSGTTAIASINLDIPKKVYLVDMNEDAISICNSLNGII